METKMTYEDISNMTKDLPEQHFLMFTYDRKTKEIDNAIYLTDYFSGALNGEIELELVILCREMSADIVRQICENGCYAEEV